MVITQIESVPQLWDEECDPAFFRLVSRVFSADFLYGASVLLANNDPDAETSGSTYEGPRAASIRSAT